MSYLAGSPSRPNLSISISSPPGASPDGRSISSLEKEIMRLQEVLREREAEITVLEVSLRESKASAPPAVMSTVENGSIPNGKPLENGIYNAETASEFGGAMSASDSDESLERLNELML
jgi:hypothetical protein